MASKAAVGAPSDATAPSRGLRDVVKWRASARQIAVYRRPQQEPKAEPGRVRFEALRELARGESRTETERRRRCADHTYAESKS